MTFYPQQGPQGTEDFNSPVGFTFTNSALQGITGEYLTLFSTLTGSDSVIKVWSDINNWSLENNLSSKIEITNQFTYYTGNATTANTVTGFQGIDTNLTAWGISTEVGVFTGGVYTGIGAFGFSLDSSSTDQKFYNSYVVNSSQATTIEFDVASTLTYSGISFLSGYASGQSNSIPALSGIVGHGIVFTDGTTWDFFEVTPFGIRSYNHPDIALPINLYSPKRIRIGIRNSDIFISSDDGRSVVGYSKFDAPVSNPSFLPMLFFGAPGKDLAFFKTHGILQTAYSSYGESYWDNIKVLTGQLSIFNEQENQVRFSTGYVSAYTPAFNPGIAINSYVSANVEAVPFNGGSTLVSVQYSGLTGWTTHTTKTITGQYTEFDLASIPVYIYPRQEGGKDYLQNPIRFKIDQKSTSGVSLPPAISKATIIASDSQTAIDMLPDWKPYSDSILAQVAITTGLYIQADPSPTTWSNFLFNTPIMTGVATQFIDESESKTIQVIGTGEVLLEGPYRSCFKNYVLRTGYAVLDSAAYQIFGSTPQTNYFSNPLFESFRTIGTGEPRFVSGLVDGELADSVYILGQYTGVYKTSFTKDTIYRPDRQARANQISSLLGSSPALEDFAQGVYVYPGTGIHNGTVGIQAKVASGIANGSAMASFDIEVSKGSGIYVSLSGSSVSNYFLPGSSFRTYREVTLPFTNNNYSEVFVKFYVPSGYSEEEIKFNIDNLTVSNYSNAYLYSTGYTSNNHISGTASTGLEYKLPYKKGATVLYGSVYLDSYPSTNSGVIFDAKGNNKGLQLFIDNSGYLSALVDLVSNTWSTDEVTDPYFIYFPRQKITSESRIPLGKWTNIGFMHDVHNYEYFGYAGSETYNELLSMASTNKLVLTVDGYPVASKDVMSGWKGKLTNRNDCAPFSSYVDITGNYNITIASGLFCKVDGIHLLTPPASEVETELSVRGARTSLPYYVPDCLYKNGNDSLLLTGITTGNYGNDYLIGMCYNFSSPYFSNWDRGPIRNHLLNYGNVTKELNSPYGDLYSTRFTSNGYAVAPYSSSYERLFNTTGALAITGYTPLLANSGCFEVLGWAYPRTTGSFFTFLQNGISGAAARLQLSLDTGSYLVAQKFDNTNTLLYAITGHQVPLNTWSYFDVRYTSTNYNEYRNTGAVDAYIGNDLSGRSFLATGANYGLLYLGRSGTTEQSTFVFGGTADINLFNVAIPIVASNSLALASTGDKGGSYQSFLESNVPYTGSVTYSDYYTALVEIGPSLTAKDRYFSMAMLNTYNTFPKLNGIVAYDNRPFKEAPTYIVGYDLSSIYNIFGSTDSPIRLGNQVPDTAINLAKFSSLPHTVPASISTIDLSDRNTNNLIPYKEGEYTIGRSSSTRPSLLTSYQNINSGVYTGMADVSISGQIVSSDIEISTVSISDPALDYGYTCYYYYLVGRGSKVVKILNSYPHYTGQITNTTTGNIPDNYFANLERIKSSIKLKNKKGEIIDKNTYPYDVTFSPYTPNSLLRSIKDSEDIYLNNIGPINSGELLADGLFTVILLTHRNKLNGESIFIHYDGYDSVSNTDYVGFKEVVNPQPLFREKHPLEDPAIGKFDLDLNNNSYYNLKIYGIENTYSGQF